MKSGRPKIKESDKRVTMQVTLSGRVARQIDRYCAENGVPRGHVIDAAIEWCHSAAMDKHEADKPG